MKHTIEEYKHAWDVMMWSDEMAVNNSNEWLWAHDLFRELIDKQTPKKPVESYDDVAELGYQVGDKFCMCPVCNHEANYKKSFHELNLSYCSWCGNLIDWSKDE
jgi:hypothetical protein